MNLSIKILFTLSIIIAFTPFAADAHKDTLDGHILFIENKGQWAEDFIYKTRISESNLYFHENRIRFDIADQSKIRDIMQFKFLTLEEKRIRKRPNTNVNHHCYDMIFMNSNTDKIIASNKSDAYFNYYIGNDPTKWKSKVDAWNKITYTNIYDGINCSIFEKDEFLKYEFYVKSGSDINKIKIRYEGLDAISISDGNLNLQTSIGKIVELKPIAWQINDTDTNYVTCKFSLKGNEVSFSFPEGYDKSKDLTIDPTLVFSTYSGSTSDNWGYTATFDNNGAVYAGGSVFGVGYPISLGAYQVNYGENVDIAISKYDPSGETMIYSTYLGGNNADVPNSLIVNSANELYVLASTGSANYPVSANCHDNNFSGGTAYTLTSVINYTNGSDMAVTCLNSTGTQLIASTYLGGSSNDGFNMSEVLKHNYADDVRGEVLLDSNSNVFVVSSTASTDLSTSDNAFQQTYGGGGQDGCIAKFDRLLTTLLWASYLGGSNDDAIYSISLKDDNTIYISGGTNSTDFPTSADAIHPNYLGGTADGFICKLSPNGTSIEASTYWGSAEYDQIYFVENDRESNAYVLGQTQAPHNDLIQNATWNKPGGGQFISKLNPNLTNCLWSTRFGTGGGIVDLSPTAFLVDYCNNIYLSAWGSSQLNGFGGTSGLPITTDAFQSTTDNNDYYFMSIKDDASDIVYGSFFGGSSAEHVDGGTSRFDRMGRIYQSVCAGCGGHDDFPTTTNAWSNTNNSYNCNNGVIKMDFNLPAIIADFNAPSIICLPTSVNFNNQSYFPNPAISTCYWDFGDGSNSTLNSPSHLYSESGIYNVKLVVNDITSCNSADSIIKQIVVLSNSTDTLNDVMICNGEYIQIGILPLSDNSISYKWTPSTFLSNAYISNPTANPTTTSTYFLEISNGVCTDTIYQKIEVINLHVDAGNDTTICSPNLELTATASGADNIKYHWSSNILFSDFLNDDENDNTAKVIYTSPHKYFVKIEANGCTAIDSIFVDFQSMSLNFTANEPLCNSDCNGSLSVTASLGQPEYTYLWSTGETTQNITNLCAGTYTVTVNDSQGCQTIDEYILEQPLPLAYYAEIGNTNCEIACNGSISGTVSGGTLPMSYQWSNGANTEDISNLCQGNYQLTITDANNCTITNYYNITVNYIYDNFSIWTTDDTIYEGQSTTLHATDIPLINYTWTPNYELSSTSGASIEASPYENTSYFVTLDDGYGCIITDSIDIVVLDVYCYEPYIFVPNTFTPNGDGKNDILYVRSNYIDEVYFAIFDRWGEKVFETRDQSNGWDGKFRGEQLEPAVFDYYVEIICYNGEKFFKKGNITLLR